MIARSERQLVRSQECSGVLVIDKPAGPTSHDVVQRVRHLLRVKKVGHLGTLDPAATGVLPLVVGDATRCARELAGSGKVYEFTLRLGARTETDDAAGKVVATAPVPSDPVACLQRAIPSFVGEIFQRPPDYSAIKVAGRRAYRMARSGGRPELALRPVRIERLEILGEDGEGIRMRLACRAGTYVRALARDLGEGIGTLGHASGIRRLRSGRFTIEQALTLEEAEADARRAQAAVIPVEALLAPETK